MVQPSGPSIFSSDEEGSSEEEEEAKDGDLPSTSTKRKRAKRGNAKKNDEIYSEFTELDEYYVSSKGVKYPSKYCLCNHCEKKKNEFEMLYPNVSIGKPVSKKLHKVTRDCKTHLKNCAHYRDTCTAEEREAVYYVGKSKPSAQSRSAPLANHTVFTDPMSMSTMESPSTLGMETATTSNSAQVAPSERKKPPSMKQATIMQYGIPRPTVPEMKNIILLLIEMVVDLSLAYNFVERPSFLRFVEALRPSASKELPDRKIVRRRIMEMAVAARRQTWSYVEAAKKLGRRLAFLIDGWNGINKKHVDGIMVKVARMLFPFKCEDAGSDHDGCRVARGWEKLLRGIGPSGQSWHYFCSDDAGQCGRARRILSLRFPHCLFVKCWAHQLNLMVKHLLLVAAFKEVTKIANAIAAAFSKSSSKWYPKLLDVLESVYGKKVHKRATSIMGIGETRWNSAQGCFASQLRIRHGLEVFCVRYSRQPKFPDAFKKLSDNGYWKSLEDAELAVRPFCDASFLMQRQVACLSHVVLVLLNMVDHLSNYADGSDYVTELVVDVEKRWKSTENPLFFLAFAFHPAFRKTAQQILKNSLKENGNWTDDKNSLSTARLTHAARFYFQKFRLCGDCDLATCNRMLAKLQRQVNMYLKDENYMAFPYEEGQDPYDWWSFFMDEQPEICILAQFLLDAPIQSADVERLFKTFAEILTKKRNRMATDGVFDTACVKDALKRKYPNDYGDAAGGQTHKNRFVDPKEYELVQDEDADELDETETELDAAMVLDDDIGNGSGDEAGEYEQGVSILGEGQDEVDFLLAALAETGEDGEDIWEESLEGDIDMEEEDDAGSTNVDDSGYDNGRLSNEHGPEAMKEGDLVEIPDEANLRFPQEDAKYFQRKRYVRKDKYALLEMLSNGEINLPSTLSAFKT